MHKVAIIDKTGLPHLLFAEQLRRRGNHVAYISPVRPGFLNVSHRHSFFEHHHIDLDDAAQLVTAMQHCDAAVACSALLPGAFSPRELATIRTACRDARVPRLIHLRFVTGHPCAAVELPGSPAPEVRAHETHAA